MNIAFHTAFVKYNNISIVTGTLRPFSIAMQKFSMHVQWDGPDTASELSPRDMGYIAIEDIIPKRG